MFCLSCEAPALVVSLMGPDGCAYNNLLHLFTLNMYVVSDFYQFILSEKSIVLEG